MDKRQFMEQLERLLSDISETERQEALSYYESYFDDAGPENEGAVIRELGSPGKLAAIIKADLKESSDSYGEYTEYGYQDAGNPGQAQTSGERKSRAGRGYHAEKKNRPGVILLIILLVFLSPFLTGAAGGVLGILAVIVLLPFLVVFGLGAAVLVLIVTAGSCIAAGISLLPSLARAGILTMGAGCFLMAVGILFLILLVWAAGKLLPWILRKVTDFCGSLLHRKAKEGEKV